MQLFRVIVIACLIVGIAFAYAPFTKEQQKTKCGVEGDCIYVETSSGKKLVTGLDLATDTWREVVEKLGEPKPSSLRYRGALLNDGETLNEYVTALAVTLVAEYKKEEL